MERREGFLAILGGIKSSKSGVKKEGKEGRKKRKKAEVEVVVDM